MTTIPTSTAPAVRQWLYNQLTATLAQDADSPTSGLLICFDDPGPYRADDIVAIGKVSRSFEKGNFVGNGGAGWLRERYTITVTIDVYRGGDDPNGVYTRAQALADGVVNVVRADLTAGKNVLSATPKSDDGEGEWDPGNKGRHWTSTVEISCFAQI